MEKSRCCIEQRGRTRRPTGPTGPASDTARTLNAPVAGLQHQPKHCLLSAAYRGRAFLKLIASRQDPGQEDR
ncbi:MAG: hypothetical protein MZV70_56545 [Desulfobacterales bacterium]|nr:hypothetical protein [Desulfobacterales bacterium]